MSSGKDDDTLLGDDVTIDPPLYGLVLGGDGNDMLLGGSRVQQHQPVTSTKSAAASQARLVRAHRGAAVAHDHRRAIVAHVDESVASRHESYAETIGLARCRVIEDATLRNVAARKVMKTAAVDFIAIPQRLVIAWSRPGAA